MHVITDQRTNSAVLSSLSFYGFEPILMPPADYLQEGVASHTDMLVFLGFERLFCHRKYYESNKTLIETIVSLAHLELVLSDEATGKQYPHDVLFNACVVGNKLICNQRTVSSLILQRAKEQSFEVVHIPQGYTKCSICVGSENAIITADKTIAETCKANGIDTLTISEGHISLPPYDYGFIGGASGLCRDKVYFCGSLERHPSGEEIKHFCEKHNKTAISLSSEKLQDVGSLFFLD